MKFNCGKSEAEKREDHRRDDKIKRAFLEDWHPYFCWWPTRITTGPSECPTQTRNCHWLETIERRGKSSWSYVNFHSYWIWEFRPLQDQ